MASDFSVEHIIPLSAGGEDNLDNFALACQGCNNHKYVKIMAKDPVGGGEATIFNPRLQRWDDHFAWSECFTLIVGITAVGRATVDALCLNRKNLVNLRRILAKENLHPP
jgi:hypothetical protein